MLSVCVKRNSLIRTYGQKSFFYSSLWQPAHPKAVLARETQLTTRLSKDLCTINSYLSDSAITANFKFDYNMK